MGQWNEVSGRGKSRITNFLLERQCGFSRLFQGARSVCWSVNVALAACSDSGACVDAAGVFKGNASIACVAHGGVDGFEKGLTREQIVLG